MSERFRALLEEWKKADREASVAQDALNIKFMAFAEGRGPEPTQEERERVDRLRTVANATLAVALEYMKTASGSRSPTQPGDL